MDERRSSCTCLRCPTCRPAVAVVARDVRMTFEAVLDLVLKAEDLTLQKLRALKAAPPPNRAERRREARALAKSL